MQLRTWNDQRNEHDALTLARMLDIFIIEQGLKFVEVSGGCEVGLRRLIALGIADHTKRWDEAAELEEVPMASGYPMLHESVLRNLLQKKAFKQQVVSGKTGATPGG